MISSVMFEDAQEADKMIANLSDMLRITLRLKEGSIHKLKDEIKILDYYLEIMKARYRDKLDVTYQIRNDCMDFPVPSFILQPLVENSIKYGMGKLSLLKIIIGSEMIDDKLKLFIKDNGPGIVLKSGNIFKNGVGLSNTQERLESLYGNKFEFYWKNLENEGFIVTLIIPGNI
jgi:LytS/YehU family sensor histidine kinase